MKRLILAGAFCAAVALSAAPASAMPIGNLAQAAAQEDGSAVQVRWGHGHGRHYGGWRGRGHHYGWYRPRYYSYGYLPRHRHVWIHPRHRWY
jgi:hypothetical protein